MNNVSVKNARRALVQRVTEAMWATADVLEAEQAGMAFAPTCRIRQYLQERSTAPQMIRAFVQSPIYSWAVNDYIQGHSDGQFLCQVVELFRELDPELFRPPRH